MEAEDRLKMYHRNVSSRSISDSIAEPWKVLANGEAGVLVPPRDVSGMAAAIDGRGTDPAL